MGQNLYGYSQILERKYLYDFFDARGWSAEFEASATGGVSTGSVEDMSAVFRCEWNNAEVVHKMGRFESPNGASQEVCECLKREIVLCKE
jgi:hypothetical protein